MVPPGTDSSDWVFVMELMSSQCFMCVKMPDMDDFQATIHSLLEQVKVYVGTQHLRRVVVESREGSGIATVYMVLRDETWAEQERAIDKMLEVQSIFLNDIGVEYFFRDAVAASDPHVESQIYASA